MREESFKQGQVASLQKLKSLSLEKNTQPKLRPREVKNILPWILVFFLVVLIGFLTVKLMIAPSILSNNEAAELGRVGKPNEEILIPDNNIINFIANGYVVAGRKATIASEVTARLVAMRYSEGDYVEKGALLAVLDSRLLVAEKEAMNSRLKAAVAASSALSEELKEASKYLKRQKIYMSPLWFPLQIMTAIHLGSKFLKRE